MQIYFQQQAVDFLAKRCKKSLFQEPLLFVKMELPSRTIGLRRRSNVQEEPTPVAAANADIFVQISNVEPTLTSLKR
jgi:hypothetical protein